MLPEIVERLSHFSSVIASDVPAFFHVGKRHLTLFFFACAFKAFLQPSKGKESDIFLACFFHAICCING